MDKTRKNRWRVLTNGARTVSLRYRVFAHEMSVRTNWVDAEFALMNSAATFITLLESRDRPHAVRWCCPPPGSGASRECLPETKRIRIELPTTTRWWILQSWPAVLQSTGSLSPASSTIWSNFRERGAWKGLQASQDLAKVVEEVTRFWGTVPYDRFFFFNIIGGPVNALEHRNSTVMTTPVRSTDTRTPYLDLVEHRDPRIFSCMERQAPAPRRAWAFRLRERGVHERAVVRRGGH